TPSLSSDNPSWIQLDWIADRLQLRICSNGDLLALDLDAVLVHDDAVAVLVSDGNALFTLSIIEHDCVACDATQCALLQFRLRQWSIAIPQIANDIGSAEISLLECHQSLRVDLRREVKTVIRAGQWFRHTTPV